MLSRLHRILRMRFGSTSDLAGNQFHRPCSRIEGVVIRKGGQGRQRHRPAGRPMGGPACARTRCTPASRSSPRTAGDGLPFATTAISASGEVEPDRHDVTSSRRLSGDPGCERARSLPVTRSGRRPVPEHPHSILHVRAATTPSRAADAARIPQLVSGLERGTHELSTRFVTATPAAVVAIADSARSAKPRSHMWSGIRLKRRYKRTDLFDRRRDLMDLWVAALAPADSRDGGCASGDASPEHAWDASRRACSRAPRRRAERSTSADGGAAAELTARRNGSGGGRCRESTLDLCLSPQL